MLSTLSAAPWRRAPWLLWRRVGLVAATAGASAVVAASLATVPLFTSSVGTASIGLQVAERCPRDTGVTRRSSVSANGVRSPSPDPFVAVRDGVGPSRWWAQVEDVALVGGQRPVPLAVSLLARDDARDHVDVLDSHPGRGIWVSDRAAGITGLGVGDVASIGPSSVEITGVYRDVSGRSVDDFWCSNGDLLLPRGPEGIPPPPLVLADRETLARVLQGLDGRSAEAAWQAPLRPDRTLTQADELLGALTCRDGQDIVVWCPGGRRPPVAASPTGPAAGPHVEATGEADFARRYLESSLPFLIDRSRAIQTSVGGGVWAIAALAALAGLGLVAAAAALWFDRRQREITLLSVRGVAPAALGVKAALELMLPVALGAAVGLGAGYVIVAVLGPSPHIEPRAIGAAAWASAATIVGSLAVVAAVVTVRGASPAARPVRRARLLRLPWELLLAALTVVSFHRLGDWGVPIGRGATVSHVDLWGLLFPVLFLVTAVAVLARLLSLAIGPLRRASATWPFALSLGVRRVARYRVAALGLVAGASLAAGVLGYAATMNRSLDATLLAKGRTFVGSDVAVQLATGEDMPDAIAAQATEVRGFRSAYVLLNGRVGLTVLAVDPDTFEQGAFWDPSFADRGLADVLDQLRAEGPGSPVPAVVVGGRLPSEVEVTFVGSRTLTLDIAPIEGVDAMPGMKPYEPTVYVDVAALDRLDADGDVTEVWARGDHDEIIGALDASGTSYEEVRTLSGIADRAAFRTVSWTFGFLQSIGISAGLLVLGGLAIYLDARRRQRVLGYAFMRRMGLTRRQHRRALGVELAASVLVGALMGLLIAIAAATLAYPQIDPVPKYPPDPLLRYGTATMVGLAIAATIVTIVAAVVGQRRIDRDDPVEVLRAGA